MVRVDHKFRATTEESSMKRVRPHLLVGLCLAALVPLATPVQAQDANLTETTPRAGELDRVVEFAIAPQALASAIIQFADQSGIQVVTAGEEVARMQSPGVSGKHTITDALHQLLRGTGLRFVPVGNSTIALAGQEAAAAVPGTQTMAVAAAAVNTEGAQDGQILTDPVIDVTEGPTTASVETVRQGGIEEIIVTGQKREERLQDVPIAISAFSAQALDEQKIEGGFDLLKAIPNVTFSKSNFTGYNFSIRGVGTKAISATTDPGVAVAFNSTTLIQNRLFEQEYLDVERVEVLRGPQGTLYGRNATSGVINVISKRPELGVFSGTLKGETGNFNTKRMTAVVNIPVIDDMLALRFAGSSTARDGFDFNTTTGNDINGRDLWSGRVSLRFEPTTNFRANLLWERFNEDDNRSRTGKQLCHRDDGPTHVGSVRLADGVNVWTNLEQRTALFGQGCKPGSLYDDAAFGTPNGLSYSFILGTIALRQTGTGVGKLPGGSTNESVIKATDPYGGLMQSRNLREIASLRDPVYRAGADLYEVGLELDISDSLTLTSQTVFNEDRTYSFQDYNRFNSVAAFNDTSAMTHFGGAVGTPSRFRNLAPGGIFCDPQIGCSDTIAGFDISKASGKQFSQELRLHSSFDGPINFSVGANYTQFETLVDYYVMFNLLTAMAWSPPFYSLPPAGLSWSPDFCYESSYSVVPVGVSIENPLVGCPYVDPNPVESINGEGHNYFRSKNPYSLESTAAFGELYWNIRDDLKMTVGLRYTDDRKSFIPVPSQALNSRSLTSGALVSKGYPEEPTIRQQWGEFTGRFGFDWKPELGFTDETLLYAFYSRGYKGGGANPPKPKFATFDESVQDMQSVGVDQAWIDYYISSGWLPVLQLTGVEYGATFDPEFVNAFEIGAKNSLFNGVLSLNLTGFYYDYKGYQVSQIRDRTAVNENFDARIWGLEVETIFAPTHNLRVNANLGYLNTRLGDNAKSIDIMDRTQSDPDYTLVKPWMQLPSNCVLPTHVAEQWASGNEGLHGFWSMCGGLGGAVNALVGAKPIPDPLYGNAAYDHANYPELNGGAGIKADLSGNELPNAPHWTANVGAQYEWDLLRDWTMTMRGDVYWQGQSWARVYNSDPYDKLHSWFNTNLSFWVEKPEQGLKIELYVKNVLNDTPITDAFLNSDDTGLTTNIFTLDPRLIGLSIRKDF
jgi:iron complex outermembrane receptor protein